MFVSVIIPSYNYEKYIGQTLQSLIAQTHKTWECIVVDDGSQDDTRRIVTDFTERDERIKYVYQNNAGQAAARNNGLRNAKGKYVQFLDADDLLEPLKLERHVEFLEKHSEVDIVYGETRYFRTEFPDERRYSMRDSDAPWMLKISGSGTEIVEKMITQNIFTVSSPLTRKKVIDAVGEFDQTLNPVEDWEYWLRCALANASIIYYEADQTMDLIRIHSRSTSQNVRNVRYKRVLLRHKFNRILTDREQKKKNSITLSMWEKSWINSEFTAGIEDIAQKQTADAVNRMWRIFRFNPLLFCKIAAHRINSSLGNKFYAVESKNRSKSLTDER